MKRLTSNESIAYLGHLKNLLEQSGVGCFIKNEASRLELMTLMGMKRDIG